MQSVSIIIPAFNEESTVGGVCRSVMAVMGDTGAEFEILVVDDGSLDDTCEKAREALGSVGRVIRHDKNMGSGMALCTGLKNARCELAIFVPADGQFDPKEIPAFAEAAAGADIVLGWRGNRENYGPIRRAQSAIYRRLVNLLFRQNFRDLSWVQMWRVSTAGSLPLRSRGVFMQQELIDRARRRGLKIVEIPSAFHQRAGGQAKGSAASTILTTLWEMLLYLLSRGR